MIRHDIKSIFAMCSGDETALREALKRTPYDDLIRIDLSEASFQMLEYVTSKYYGISKEGDFARLVAYAADHFVHPEDREQYLEFYDLLSLPERFANAGLPGYLEGEFRLRGTNDAWIRTQQVLIRGDFLHSDEAARGGAGGAGAGVDKVVGYHDNRIVFHDADNPGDYNIENRPLRGGGGSAASGSAAAHPHNGHSIGKGGGFEVLRNNGTTTKDPKDTVWLYVYDMQDTVQEDDFSIFVPGVNPDMAPYEEVTGLLRDLDFFRPAQDRLPEFKEGNWCLIAIDIKHYKLFVDWYGVESGQYLLSQFAEVLRDVEREDHGMCGYMGQDQFCLIIHYDMAKIEAAHARLKELISSISPIEGFEPYFGIALIDDSSNQIQEFFNRAALTGDEIKDNINTTIRVYDPSIHKQNAREYEILFAFQSALENGEIFFHLQPQYRVSNHKIVGAEALARWHRADGSWLSPAVFVPILEKHGQVHKLDLYIWESVCAWCRSWIDRGRALDQGDSSANDRGLAQAQSPDQGYSPNRGHKLVPVSLNVSRQDITAIDVPQTLESLLEKYGLSHEDIQVEITESAYTDDINPVHETVQLLRQKGFTVLMDDFGSGYSSLSMLRNLNMDVIKLDAQFMQIGREEEAKGVSIVESIVNMTRNLSTPIIVEGVEDEFQAQFLAELGCTYMQGYYFARPMPVEEFEALIGDEIHVDDRGFVFKANQQLRVREFFDENIYSDAMLNNILGAIAFYNQVGEDVSIVRYNEQFFELTGLNESEMSQRIESIQRFMPGEDRKRLMQILAHAEEHLTLGGHGVVKALKPNGVFVYLDLQVFFLEEDAQGKKYYVSARDVTETQFLNEDMPGAYYRTTTDEDYEFLYISQNFLDMTGYTREEIRYEFDNKMNNMTHPADRVDVHEWSAEILEGKGTEARPYRIKRKRGDYIYIAEKDQITDRFGVPCYQSIAIDVTEMMVMRNQMRILSEHLTDTILFVRPLEKDGVRRYEFEVVIYNLEELMGTMSAEEFQELLNDGTFFDWMEGYEELIEKTGLSQYKFVEWYLDEICHKRRKLNVHLPSGETFEMAIRADRVQDENTRVEYIIMLRAMG